MSNDMTDRELRRLRRQDLLQMLLAQSRESVRLQTELDEKDKDLHLLQENYERLKKKLDEKDAQIEKLKGRLDHKDNEIGGLREELRICRSEKWGELDEESLVAEVVSKLKTALLNA